MKERNYVIYALVDPKDESVRYVGISDNMPTRFTHHLRETGSRTAKGMWLAELRSYGLKPTIMVLEEVTVEQKRRYIAEERERYWIRVFEQSGTSLTNVRDMLSDPRKSSNGERRKVLANSLRGLDGSKAVPILDQLRIRAGLRVNELADLSDVSESSLRKMIRGEGVSGVLVTVR